MQKEMLVFLLTIRNIRGNEMTIDFFAIDVETANSKRGSICALG